MSLVTSFGLGRHTFHAQPLRWVMDPNLEGHLCPMAHRLFDSRYVRSVARITIDVLKIYLIEKSSIYPRLLTYL